MFPDQLPFPSLRPRDALEIVIVAAIIYRVLRLLVGTRTLQILLGLLVLVGVYITALLLDLRMLAYLLGVVFTYGAFAAVVVFQPELRQALARLGRARLFRFFEEEARSVVVQGVAEAVERLSRNGTGAIIAIEREMSLDEYIESGTPLHATVSADLLATIFSPYAPLHDGAVIIRGDQIIAAGCILPLTQFPLEDRSLGTRHRAALGLSDETDAVVIVVSEETTAVSIAERGQLRRPVAVDQLRTALSGRPPQGEPATPNPLTQPAT